ncbi:MAG TPA: nuclear transport factor 2 family protein [Aggregicoccus sp.]|nr:nuclear transport factor 2 family protein [Aggregicoccus sp.]
MSRFFPILSLVPLLLTATLTLAEAPSAGAREAAVRKPLEAYLRGHTTGDGRHFREAFWPEGHLVFVRDGKLTTLSAEAFAARASGKPGDPAVRRSIERVEVAGRAATATVLLDGPTNRITDFMTLLEVDGEWRIIHKSFHAEPKAGAAAAK